MVTYKCKEIIKEVSETGGLTRSGRCYSPEELRKDKHIRESQMPIKKPVTEEEAEEFLKKMKVQDYSIIDQLRKTPAQITLLSLLIHSEENDCVLIKILNEAHVSEKTTVNQLEKMASRYFEVNRISFTDNELPEERDMHYRALDLIVKCEGHYVKRVMIDGGSSVDILKFKHDRQEIIVHREDESSIYKDLLISCIDANEGCESIVYQAFDMVVVDHVEEGKPILHPCLSVNLSINVDFNNMTCMRNSCLDLKKLSKFEIMHEEVEYDEDEVVEEIKKEDVFACSYDDIPSLSVDIVVHKLPMYLDFSTIQQKKQKFKTDMNDKIKEEIMKQLSANVVRAPRYTTWVANVVHLPKKDGKPKICVDYRDLNKASPKDNFPLPNIHILVDNCAKHEIQSFVDFYARYHQILMDEDHAEKTAFTTPWGTYCYRVMPVSLKNVGTTYMRAMTTIFHDMMHKEIEVYVDDVIIKSNKQVDHMRDLKTFFELLRRYNLRLNPAKCAFGVPSWKLLDFIVSRRGIELDPSKIKSIRDLPPPKNKNEVLSLLGRLNYISRFIAQLTTTFEPIFKLLQKDVAINWMDDCQKAFDRIKDYLSKPSVLIPPQPEFDIVYVTRTAMKSQAFADHLVENLVDDDYKPLSTYFLDKEVNLIEEVVLDDNHIVNPVKKKVITRRDVVFRESEVGTAYDQSEKAKNGIIPNLVTIPSTYNYPTSVESTTDEVAEQGSNLMRKLWLSQEKYIKCVLVYFNMKSSKPVSTPLAGHLKLSKKMCPTIMEQYGNMARVPYSSAVGSLMYAMVRTRPDIAHAVGVVSRFLENLRREHWEEFK
ncbi:uncharacterized protein [Nicotiana tomentosiformis]|uniref:uncharacterized protein n=1 Tax=Nicotiana tomentosiformis TaxID=4098 RepID=UPI00388C7F48